MKGAGPTYDYRQFDPEKLPKNVTLASLKGLSENGPRFENESVTLQNVKRHASENEDCKNPTLHKLKRVKVSETLKTRASKGFPANP